MVKVEPPVKEIPISILKKEIPITTTITMSKAVKEEPTDHTRSMGLRRWPSESSILSKLASSHVCHLRWSRLVKTVIFEQTKNIGLSLEGSKAADGHNNANLPTLAPRKILSKVSGCAAPGELLAIMGPHGCGKTTLLNILSGRTGYNSGVVSFSGIQLTPGSSVMNRFQAKMAYVKKSDIFLEHLTVRDQLLYTALLRMPQDMLKSEKKEEVEKVIRQFDLKHVADSAIHQLSVCERRRLNIGTELLTDPCCIFLDEPTRYD
jgi:ABC-type lipoprotein export system ATPase subunit